MIWVFKRERHLGEDGDTCKRIAEMLYAKLLFLERASLLERIREGLSRITSVKLTWNECGSDKCSSCKLTIISS